MTFFKRFFSSRSRPTPMHSEDLLNAAFRGDAAAVRALLDKGADVNTKNTDGLTALILASREGHIKVVQALLAKGAEVKPTWRSTVVLKNPVTGKEKRLTVHSGGTWTFLFGPFYLMYHRVWLHAILMLIAAGYFQVPLQIVYVFFAKGLIFRSYLKRGYRVVAYYPDGKEVSPWGSAAEIPYNPTTK